MTTTTASVSPPTCCPACGAKSIHTRGQVVAFTCGQIMEPEYEGNGWFPSQGYDSTCERAFAAAVQLRSELEQARALLDKHGMDMVSGRGLIDRLTFTLEYCDGLTDAYANEQIENKELTAANAALRQSLFELAESWENAGGVIGDTRVIHNGCAIQLRRALDAPAPVQGETK